MTRSRPTGPLVSMADTAKSSAERGKARDQRRARNEPPLTRQDRSLKPDDQVSPSPRAERALKQREAEGRPIGLPAGAGRRVNVPRPVRRMVLVVSTLVVASQEEALWRQPEPALMRLANQHLLRAEVEAVLLGHVSDPHEPRFSGVLNLLGAWRAGWPIWVELGFWLRHDTMREHFKVLSPVLRACQASVAAYVHSGPATCLVYRLLTGRGSHTRPHRPTGCQAP